MPVCEHIGTRGANNGKACKNAANHGAYCKKHQKREVPTNLAQDSVFGNGKAAPAEPPRDKLRFSVFKWTIVSQQDFGRMSDAEKRQFKNVIDFLFDPNNLPDYLHDRNNEDSRVNIRDIKEQHYYEVGEKQHRLHVHGVAKLAHVGYYRLDEAKMRAVCLKLLGRAVHLSISASGDADAAWNQYILKMQNAKPVEL